MQASIRIEFETDRRAVTFFTNPGIWSANTWLYSEEKQALANAHTVLEWFGFSDNNETFWALADLVQEDYARSPTEMTDEERIEAYEKFSEQMKKWEELFLNGLPWKDRKMYRKNVWGSKKSPSFSGACEDRS